MIGLQKGTPVQFPSGQGVMVVSEPDSDGWVIVQDERGEYRRVAAENIKLIKTEREKFIDTAYEIADMTTSWKVALGNLYDSGKFKLIEEEQS